MIEIDDNVLKVLGDALAKGRQMRDLQKRYFKTRQQILLTQSKVAERDFDEALDAAAYALRTGEVPPTQPDLFPKEARR